MAATPTPPTARSRSLVDSDDPRAVSTRQKLVDAFFTLSGSGTLTVSALTDKAGVHRSVFYKHFESPDDLAIYLLRDLFAALTDTDILMRGQFEQDGLSASRNAMSAFVDFVGASRAVYAPLLGPHAPAAAVRRIVDAFAEKTAEAIEQMTTKPPEVDTAVTARFLANGVLGVVGDWLDDAEPPMSGEQVVEQLVACFPAWLTDPAAPSNTKPSERQSTQD